jgi:hypothetical protein
MFAAAAAEVSLFIIIVFLTENSKGDPCYLSLLLLRDMYYFYVIF